MEVLILWWVKVIKKLKWVGTTVYFRKRIGTGGAEKLLKLRVSLFEKKEVEEQEILIDTSVQEKYEFGSKSGFVIKKNSGIILGAIAFEGNPYAGQQLNRLSDISKVITGC